MDTSRRSDYHNGSGRKLQHLAPAALPCSGYLSPPAYVPTGYARGLRFTGDSKLNAILEASMADGNNDVFLSNLVNSRIRLIHGGADENVPSWNSREMLSIVKTWSSDADIQ